MEVWKDIIDFPNYQVSNLGRVKSKGKILKSTKDNLEWCTRKYNNNYGTKNKRISNTMKKKIGQYDKNNNLIKAYESISEASKRSEINIASISRSVNNIQKTAGGYVWHFV